MAQSSSLDTRKRHPYVVDETIRMRLYGLKARWETAKIVRKTYPNNPNKPDEIVNIIRIQKKEE